MAPKTPPFHFSVFSSPLILLMILVTSGCPVASASHANSGQGQRSSKPTSRIGSWTIGTKNNVRQRQRTSKPTSSATATPTPTPDPPPASSPTPTPTPAPTATPTSTATYTPVAGYATSWLANTFGGGSYAPSTTYPFVQPDAQDLSVTPSGVAVVADYYDEGHRMFGMYQNGQVVGSISWNCVGGPTHLRGGYAVTNNGTYIYIAVYDDSSSSNKINYVQRYDLNENPSTFSGGSGGCSNQITVDTSASAPIYGLAASATELYVADGSSNSIDVYDANTMALKRHFAFTNPRRLAYDVNTNTLWISQGGANSSFAGNVYHFDVNGNQLSGTITNVAVPHALAIQPGTGYLWVADYGPDQNLKIYNNAGQQVGTFGVQGGIYSGTPGLLASNKLFYPVGIGFDASSNIYTVGIGAHFQSDLRAFNSSGNKLWGLQGFGYVDTGAPDPATDGQDVYTTFEHYKMNYSNLTTGAGGGGTEQTWYATTVDPLKYPLDPRLLDGFPTVSQVQNVGGNKYLAVTDMYSNSLMLFRFNGEIAVPMAMLTRQSFYYWPTQPSPPWFWQDTNGNGNPDSGEFTQLGSISNAQDWFLDANGNVWYANVTGTNAGINEFPLQAINSSGNLTYSPTGVVTYGIPAPFNQVQNVFYDAANDVMYVSGYTPSLPFGNNEPYGTHSAGTVIARYNHWSAGNRTAAWTANLPHNPSAGITIRPWTVAGGKIFAGLFETQNNSSGQVIHNIYVYDASSGASLGEMMPGVETNYFMGWLDCNQTLQAIQRSNGEYVVFEEEEVDGKVTVLRGLLNDFTQY